MNVVGAEDVQESVEIISFQQTQIRSKVREMFSGTLLVCQNSQSTTLAPRTPPWCQLSVRLFMA